MNYSEPRHSHNHTHWFHPMNQGLQDMSGCGRSNHSWRTTIINIIAVITAADIKSHDGPGVSGPPLIFSCRPGFSNVEQKLKLFESFTQRLSPLQNKNMKRIPAVRVTVIIGLTWQLCLNSVSSLKSDGNENFYFLHSYKSCCSSGTKPDEAMCQI